MILTSDDIQGTACVTQAAIKSAVWVTKGNIRELRIIIFGAGTAGTGILEESFCLTVGIADQLRDTMALEGNLSKEEAATRIWSSQPFVLANVQARGQNWPLHETPR